MSKPGSVLTMKVSKELNRAEILARNGAWEAADAIYSTAITVDASPASRIAFGASLATRERYNEAICQLTAGIDLATESGHREALGVIFHNLAAIYRELGDADLARRFQQQSLLQSDDCGPVELLGLANDAWLSRRTELAACLANSCVELDQDDLVSEDLEALATVGVMSGLLEDPRQGIKSLIQIYRQHQSRNETRLAGIDLMNLAILCSEIGWYVAEARLVRRAIAHFDMAQAPVSASRARQLLAHLERLQSLRGFDPSLN